VFHWKENGCCEFEPVFFSAFFLGFFRLSLPENLCSVFAFYLLLSVVTYFWVHIKIRKYKKKYIKRNPNNNRSEKKDYWNAERMPKLVEEIQKCKRLKFDSESHVDEKNLILGRKVQNQMFMDSIKFYPRFN
jgi:hypothetical protein